MSQVLDLNKWGLTGKDGRFCKTCPLCRGTSEELRTGGRPWSLRVHIVEAHGLDLFPACSVCLKAGASVYCRFRLTDVKSHIARVHDLDPDQHIRWYLILTRGADPSKLQPMGDMAICPGPQDPISRDAERLLQQAAAGTETQEPQASTSQSQASSPPSFRKLYREKRARSNAALAKWDETTTEDETEDTPEESSEEESEVEATPSDGGAQVSPPRAHTSSSSAVRPAPRRRSPRREQAETAVGGPSQSWEEAPLPEHQSALVPEVATLLGVSPAEVTQFQRMLNRLDEVRPGGAHRYLWDCRIAPHQVETALRGTKGPGTKKSGKRT